MENFSINTKKLRFFIIFHFILSFSEENKGNGKEITTKIIHSQQRKEIDSQKNSLFIYRTRRVHYAVPVGCDASDPTGTATSSCKMIESRRSYMEPLPA